MWKGYSNAEKGIVYREAICRGKRHLDEEVGKKKSRVELPDGFPTGDQRSGTLHHSSERCGGERTILERQKNRLKL